LIIADISPHSFRQNTESPFKIHNSNISMKHDLPVFALLIDADNVSKDAIAPIIEEVTRHARIAVRRVYGDFTTPNLGGWRDTLANHGIHPIQQYRNSTGKNSSDSALIIDAMDLLHLRRFDGFCLVSSDGDFTRLATRIREDGLTVFGFGRKDAAKAFVQACDSYIYIENLINPPELIQETKAKEPASLPTIEGFEPPKASEIPKSASTNQAAKTTPSSDIARLKKLALRAYTNVADEDSWALVSRVEQYLRANHSELNPSNYGTSTFFKLLSNLDIFEIGQRKQGNGHAQFCRLKGRRNPPSAYVNALKAAVMAARSSDGWASIAAIRSHLNANGHRLDESGYESLDLALRATGTFDMRDAGGTNKEFRLSAPGSQIELRGS
jgi:uncharacterized LabA/DUF88 family protein